MNDRPSPSRQPAPVRRLFLAYAALLILVPAVGVFLWWPGFWERGKPAAPFDQKALLGEADRDLDLIRRWILPTEAPTTDDWRALATENRMPEKRRPAYRATLLVRNGNFAEAYRTFETGTTLLDRSIGWFHRPWIRAAYFGGESMDLLIDQARKHRLNPLKTLEHLAECVLEVRDLSGLRWLEAQPELREEPPPWAVLARARLDAWEGRIDESLRLGASVWSMAEPAVLHGWLSDLTSAGGGLRAYERLRDPQAFVWIGNRLWDLRQTDALERVVEARRRDQPDDADVHTMQMNLDVLRGRWREAAQGIRLRDPSPPNRWPAGSLYVTCLLEADRGEFLLDTPKLDERLARRVRLALARRGRAAALDRLGHQMLARNERATARLCRIDACLLRGQIREAAQLVDQSPRLSDDDLASLGPAWAGSGQPLTSLYSRCRDAETFVAQLVNVMPDGHPGVADVIRRAMLWNGKSLYVQGMRTIQLVREGQYPVASEMLSGLVAKVTPAGRAFLRPWLLRVAVRLGRLEGFLTSEPWEVQSVAAECVRSRRFDQLRVLAKAIESRGTPLPGWWPMAEKACAGDPEAFVRWARSHERVIPLWIRLHPPAARWYIQACHESGDVELARREAQRLAACLWDRQQSGPDLLELYTAVQANDVEAAIAANRGVSWHSYGDPEIGPILRSPRFAAFRERYPPPAEPATGTMP